MAIKIIPEPDIFVTQAEYNRYVQDWNEVTKNSGVHPSFENFVRQCKLNEALYPSNYNSPVNWGMFNAPPY